MLLKGYGKFRSQVEALQKQVTAQQHVLDEMVKTLAALRQDQIQGVMTPLSRLEQALAVHAARTDATLALISQNMAIVPGAVVGSQIGRAAQIMPPGQSMTLEEIAERLREDYPKLFPLWEERLGAMRDEFIAHGRVGNAAHGADPAGNFFRQFIAANRRGRVLDVGCGVHGKPYYLSDIPDAEIGGIDPLEPLEPMPIAFATGIGEYIPWADASFETVVSGTSMDHCIDIERTLQEFMRVLQPGGNILIWMSFVKGAKPFAPDDPDWEPEDIFHLYHADEPWFEPLLSAQFEIRQKVKFYAQSFDHCFYELESKRDPEAIQMPSGHDTP